MPEETEIPVRVIRMSEPATQKKDPPVNPVAGSSVGVANRVSDVILCLRRQHFVGIQDEDPIVLKWEMFERPIFLLRPATIELKLHHFRSILLRNLRRVVRALRIDHEDFVSPLHAGVAAGQILSFVLDWNQNRYGNSLSHRGRRTLHGLPAAMTFSGTSFVTTEQAPMI